MIAHLIAYEGRGVHFRSASDAARRLLKQTVLRQAEWNYGRQEQVDNIARKQWGRSWRKKLDGVSSLEYSIELAHRQPIDAMKSITLALARAAQHYLSWYERNDRFVTYEKVYHDYTQRTSEGSFHMLMTELFGKFSVTTSNMIATDFEIKTQRHAMNEGSAMATHKQVYEKLGITPTNPVVATPKQPRLMPPPMPSHDFGAQAAGFPPAPPVPPKWIPRPATAVPAQGADAAAGASSATPLPPPPKVPGQRGPYPTDAEAATHAARSFWRPAD